LFLEYNKADKSSFGVIVEIMPEWEQIMEYNFEHEVGITNGHRFGF